MIYESMTQAIGGYQKIEDASPLSHKVNGAVQYGSSQEAGKIPVNPGFSWSALTFSWFQPIITLGAKKLITKDDMLDLPKCLTSKEVLATFKQCWTYESLKLVLRNSGYSPTTTGLLKPKLWRVLHTMIQREFWFAGTCRLLNDALLVSYNNSTEVMQNAGYDWFIDLLLHLFFVDMIMHKLVLFCS